jgi:flavodoxin
VYWSSKEATMPQGKACVLYWSKSGNTQKVALRIQETLRNAGMDVTIARISADLRFEYRDYNLVFLGAPVYENLAPPPVLSFLRQNKKRVGVEELASAPEIPGIAAIPFCTYGGGHTGYGEAEPMLKHTAQFFEHEGIRVVDTIAVVANFGGADSDYNTAGRFGDIRQRPNESDLAEVEGRVRGILRRLHLVLPLGKLNT